VPIRKMSGKLISWWKSSGENAHGRMPLTIMFAYPRGIGEGASALQLTFVADKLLYVLAIDLPAALSSERGAGGGYLIAVRFAIRTSSHVPRCSSQ
jgi:hypothetical protein